MLVQLYVNKSNNNVLNKDITLLKEIECQIKEPCSIEKPILIVKDFPFSCNYVFIENLNRYYYVNDITMLNNGISQVTFNEDFLMSNKENLLNVNALCLRNENASLTYQLDDNLPISTEILTECYQFTNGFSDKLQYVLTVLGG